MKLKLNLKGLTKDDLEEAKNSGVQRYDGPVPPVGRYNVKVSKLWAAKTRAGDDQLVALLVFSNEGENKTYNGATIFHRMSIPTDPSDQYFAIRVKSLNDFLVATSGGKLDIHGFVNAANDGKIQVGKKDNVGEPIEQIAKFKTANAKDITIKTKMGSWNGEERAECHFVDTSGIQKEDEYEEDDDLDLEDDGDDFDLDEELDDLLGDDDDD